MLEYYYPNIDWFDKTLILRKSEAEEYCQNMRYNFEHVLEVPIFLLEDGTDEEHERCISLVKSWIKEEGKEGLYKEYKWKPEFLNKIPKRYPLDSFVYILPLELRTSRTSK